MTQDVIEAAAPPWEVYACVAPFGAYLVATDGRTNEVRWDYDLMMTARQPVPVSMIRDAAQRSMDRHAPGATWEGPFFVYGYRRA